MAQKSEILVIGTGLAGLAFALKAAEFAQVTLVSKVTMEQTNTTMAQGGIAAVISRTDSLQKHIEDTLIAGAGLCHMQVVEEVISQGPERIQDLTQWGVEFDRGDEPEGYRLGQEGGHSERRILHVADQTGQAVHKVLLRLALNHSNISVVDNHFALDLILNKHLNAKDFSKPKCVGAFLLDNKTGVVVPHFSKMTVLATGGAGKAYLYTSNWAGATGDGIAMAHRAGARIANMEFMQFHPTCLYHPHSRNFLISEALRGEGGTLINSQGEDFTHKYHPKGSLAPRDVVARAIDAEMKTTGADSVFLDITHHSKEFLQARFPVIYQKCLEFNIDISRQPIPVVPAAHYLCGGIVTDLYGQTDIAKLYALGETACTGLHGANRLASNSLLECLVFSHNAAKDIQAKLSSVEFNDSDQLQFRSSSNKNSDELIVVHHMWDEIRRLMWNYVGIVRSDRRLQRAENRLKNLIEEIRDYYTDFETHSDIEELRNIATVALLTVKCARSRKESRGIHYSLDYPETMKDTSDSIADTFV